ncbi:MAG: hypothetical protein QOG96_5643, partial [Pseudonocardiales bacterium]|nr:hypothetical protein [Pseudonocardiales bacterium]
ARDRPVVQLGNGRPPGYLGERLSGARAEHPTGAHPQLPDLVSVEWSPGTTRHTRGLTSQDDTYPGN